MAFKKATKKQQKLRLAITGPAGAGKTYTALVLAKNLGTRIALIDTERGSASKYAGDVADFDTNELDTFGVQHYLRAIEEARVDGYDVLVIDSLSHAWAGKGGILEEADNRGGKFQAWKQLTPMQHALVDAILGYPGHVIATMRSKMSYEVSTEEGRNGKKETSVVKLGLAPVQREGMEYEFDVILDMSISNVATVTKSRCVALSGQAIPKPGKQLADTLKAWLSDGAKVGDERYDEFGLLRPTVPCPVIRPGRQHAGKRWDELPGGLLQKMHDDDFDRMNADQQTWVRYLVERRAKRKAMEAAAEAQRARTPDYDSDEALKARREHAALVAADAEADRLALEQEEAERALAKRDAEEAAQNSEPGAGDQPDPSDVTTNTTEAAQ